MVTRGHGPTRGALRGARDGGNIWWIAPTYPIASDIWRDLKKACRDAWVDKSEVERRIDLPGGGAVTVKSSDNPDSLRGSGLDGVVLDEAANIRPDAWFESIRPALSDKQGWAVFIGTPRGFNWFHDLFRQAEHMPGWRHWQRPSSDNPLLTPAELATARKEVGSIVYGQEYEAQFIADGLGMFRRHWFTLTDSKPAKAQRCRYWDKSGTEGGGDYSAGVLMAKTDEGYVIEDVVRGQWSSHNRNQIMVQTAQIDGKKTQVVVEQEPGSSGKESAEYTIKMLAGWPVHADKVTGDKEHRARPLAAQCEAGNVKVLQASWTKEFLDELCTFPGGSHDDQVDAAAGSFNRLALVNRPGWGDDKERVGRTAVELAPKGAWG